MQEAHYKRREPLPKGFIDGILLLAREQTNKPLVKEEYIKRKMELTREHSLDHVPSDIEILTYLSPEENAVAKTMLMTKPIRTGSGVTVVAVMTKPLPCPHGKCTYCPGGPGSAFGDVPQSYTGHEPATLRGIRAKYDIYTQIFNRLEQYILMGHNPEKVELILMGGTFPSYDNEYQEETVHDIYQAMDDFSREFYPEGTFDLARFKEFFMLPGSIHDTERTSALQEKIMTRKKSSPIFPLNIKELQLENERATIRCIGLTIETRPSHAKLAHANRMLEQGCTRVELGVQTTFDEVLTKVHRDHTVQDTIDAIADLKDLGFKINYHIMLGLPLMTPERDIEAAHRLFDDPAFKPDMLKIYPCMVMPGTALFYDWKQGKYAPYSTEQAARVIADIKRFVPTYVRIMRIQRDIPTKVTTAGVGQTNLRQIVDSICENEGIACGCIRCRESRKGKGEDITLNTSRFSASGGEEFFISVDDSDGGLLGFCRLRFPARSLRSEITSTSGIIRELHVYGTATGLGEEGRVQHKGVGRKLMGEAERLCVENGKNKLLVISGVGVREYYERLGYTHDGPYMSKQIG